MSISKTNTQSPKSLPTATHLFAIGQAVRLKGGLWPTGNVYSITATIPPTGDSLQYRIRSAAEKFERMATQDNLEAVSAPAGENATLLEETFSTDGKDPAAAPPTVGPAQGEDVT